MRTKFLDNFLTLTIIEMARLQSQAICKISVLYVHRASKIRFM